MKSKFFNKLELFYHKKFITFETLDTIVIKVATGVFDVSTVDANFDFLVSNIDINRILTNHTTIGNNVNIFKNNSKSTQEFFKKITIVQWAYFKSIIEKCDFTQYPKSNEQIQKTATGTITVPINQLNNVFNFDYTISSELDIVFIGEEISFEKLIFLFDKHYANFEKNISVVDNIKIIDINNKMFEKNISKLVEMEDEFIESLFKNKCVTHYFINLWDFNEFFIENLLEIAEFDINVVLMNMSEIDNPEIEEIIEKYGTSITIDTWNYLNSIGSEIILEKYFYYIKKNEITNFFNKNIVVNASAKYNYPPTQLQYLIDVYGHHPEFIFHNYNATTKFGIINSGILYENVIPGNIEQIAKFVVEHEWDEFIEISNPNDDDIPELAAAIYRTNFIKNKYILMNDFEDQSAILKEFKNKNINFFKKNVEMKNQLFLFKTKQLFEALVNDLSNKIEFVRLNNNANITDSSISQVISEYESVFREHNTMTTKLKNIGLDDFNGNIKQMKERFSELEDSLKKINNEISDYSPKTRPSKNVSDAINKLEKMKTKYIADVKVVISKNTKMCLCTHDIGKKEKKHEYLHRIKNTWRDNVSEYKKMNKFISDNNEKPIDPCFSKVKKQYKKIMAK